jgi:serine/threonine protein kinase
MRTDETDVRPPGPYQGMLLAGRYLLERELGRGGIGVIYFARDQQLMGKPVVVKILLDLTLGAEADEWVKRKFRQEVEALARIDHPGVVGVLQAGEMADGKPYLVIQYIEGETLRSVMGADGMELARVARIVRQIGHALTGAHDRGIYHRDLKPENIMLQSLGEGEEHVKLIDFGIATVKDPQAAADQATTTMFSGTPGYMAPEQLLGKPTAASDVYALGVIAHEMLTGRRPFRPDSPYHLLELQREGVRVKPRELRPDLPERAQALVLQALSFEQAARPARARAFGDELSRALLDGAAPAAPAAPVTYASSTVVETRPAAAAPTGAGSAPAASRVALLYRRGAQPDEQVMRMLEAELKAQGHEVFIDRHTGVGGRCARPTP